jgi:hypothetical protein
MQDQSLIISVDINSKYISTKNKIVNINIMQNITYFKIPLNILYNISHFFVLIS